ncbi:MAG: BON domain-containing protein [Burkholderiales bacterium]|jgi:osmotically-inducible protein OsmY|nr:BON domain-containing protein [Burkholderiales bacterium]
MTTNSRLGNIIPVTGATLIALALSGVRAQAAVLQQTPAPMPSALQPQPGMQGQTSGATSSRSPGESAAKSLDDALITTKVKAKLLEDQSLKSLQIHVTTLKSVVHLTGNVAHAKDVSHAVQLAQALPDVKMVMSDLQVQG